MRRQQSRGHATQNRGGLGQSGQRHKVGCAVSQPGHIITVNRKPNRTEPNRTERSVFSVFGFGFGFGVGEVRSSVSASVSDLHRTDKPSKPNSQSNKREQASSGDQSTRTSDSPRRAQHRTQTRIGTEAPSRPSSRKTRTPPYLSVRETQGASGAAAAHPCMAAS
jgi:hypothetical protein